MAEPEVLFKGLGERDRRHRCGKAKEDEKADYQGYDDKDDKDSPIQGFGPRVCELVSRESDLMVEDGVVRIRSR